jgi:hypothetical protein
MASKLCESGFPRQAKAVKKSSNDGAAPQWQSRSVPAARKTPKKPSHTFTIATCCAKKFLT